MKQHNYQTTITWTGNTGTGTSDYTVYGRSHTLSIENKPDILCSSDVAFRGDGTKHNPEDFFVAAISQCHMLWFLHLCADAGVVVTAYEDRATGVLTQTAGGRGHFTEVTLHPIVTVTEDSMIATANSLHEQANNMCFIANSLNFTVSHEPVCVVDKS